jgi:hypothetical protein
MHPDSDSVNLKLEAPCAGHQGCSDDTSGTDNFDELLQALSRFTSTL